MQGCGQTVHRLASRHVISEVARSPVQLKDRSTATVGVSDKMFIRITYKPGSENILRQSTELDPVKPSGIISALLSSLINMKSKKAGDPLCIFLDAASPCSDGANGNTVGSQWWIGIPFSETLSRRPKQFATDFDAIAVDLKPIISCEKLWLWEIHIKSGHSRRRYECMRLYNACNSQTPILAVYRRLLLINFRSRPYASKIIHIKGYSQLRSNFVL